MAITLPEKSEGVTHAIDTSCAGLNIRIDQDKAKGKILNVKLAIDPKLILGEEVQLEARLAELPINLPTRQLGEPGDMLWELQIPPNVVQLLLKPGAKSSYKGTLVLDDFGQSLPLSLDFQPGKASGTKRPSSRKSSAG